MKVSPYWFLVQKLICCSPKLKRRTTTFSSPNVPVTSFLTSKQFAYSLSFLDFFCFTFIPLAHPRYNIEAKLFHRTPVLLLCTWRELSVRSCPILRTQAVTASQPLYSGTASEDPYSQETSLQAGDSLQGAHTASAGWHSTISVQQHSQHT